MSEYPWDRLTKRQFSEVICCKVHHAFVAFELHTKFGTPDEAKSEIRSLMSSERWGRHNHPSKCSQGKSSSAQWL